MKNIIHTQLQKMRMKEIEVIPFDIIIFYLQERKKLRNHNRDGR